MTVGNEAMMGSGNILGYVLPVAVIVALIAAVRYLVKKVGLSCQFCENARCDYFQELGREEQGMVLSYFREYEHREPDTTGIFVCRKCRTVYDDFSGEKDSMSPDRLVYRIGSYRHAIDTCTAFCKACNTLILQCDPDNDEILCPKCRTPYKWQVYGKTGYRFLMPPPGIKILERCHDHTMGTA